MAGKVEAALALLGPTCRVCPRYCRVDRLRDERALCRTGRRAFVASAFPHFGEEDCLRGWRGSGTIFFTHCNLKCVFCQNFDISQGGVGREASADEVAGFMLELERRGCHNVNFVTPEHVVPQVVEAIALAVEAGLGVPIVYNTSGFDSPESLAVLDGLVDVYMPDFKFWSAAAASRYAKATRYPEVVRHSIREMHRQVGDLVLDADGLAVRGLLVRHLVMPGDVAGTREILRFLARDISPDTYVNLMDQYHPAGRTGLTPEIDRPLRRDEYAAALRIAHEEGVRRLDARSMARSIRRLRADSLNRAAADRT
jgi:putative pyruvate formate lyase activating enzyme